MPVKALPVEDLTLSPAHYLPSEVLRRSNYPEIGQYAGEIAVILAYTEIVESALSAYNQGISSTIDISYDELLVCIELARTVCDVLGRTTNICFDILIELRKCLKIMQEVTYLYSKYGSQLVGSSASEGGGV